MRKFLFLLTLQILCFSTIYLYSQTVLTGTHNLPRHGDRLVKQQVNYIEPGDKGTDVLWDFSHISSVDDYYELSYTATSGDSIIGREHHTLYYYQSKNDSLFLAGYENHTTLMNYTCAEPLLAFPVMYGRSMTGYFGGKGDYCNRLHINTQGKSMVTADATGQLVLPGGDTLTHVIRVHTLKKMTEQMCPYSENGERDANIDSHINKDSVDFHLATDSIRIEVETWRWYADSYRYPVFESIRSTVYRFDTAHEHFRTSFYYPPDQQYYELYADAENQYKRNQLEETKRKWGSSENKIPLSTANNRKINYSYYYDSSQNLQIEYQLQKDTELSFTLYDILGRQRCKDSGIVRSEGHHLHSILLTSYPAGEYLLQIIADGEVYTEKIIKK